MTTSDRPIRLPRPVGAIKSRPGLDAPITAAGASADSDPLELDAPPPPAPHVARAIPTFTIHAVVNGFPVDVSIVGTSTDLLAAIARLCEIGAVPPTPASHAAVDAERQREAPICPYHGAMKESSKRAGTWYCPAKMGDGSYCKEKSPH